MAFTMQSAFGDIPEIYNLDFPVGPKMPNTRTDVLLIQTLMKMANFTRFTPAMGPVERSADIKVDGWFGPQTARMIKAFEADRVASGMLLVADGVFEGSTPDGFTGKGFLYKIIHLNRSAMRAGGWKFVGLPFLGDTDPLLSGALIESAIRPSWA
jgi:peptidoglycan hydrolase-like protein with peptidoglycan-binding domain